MNGVRVNLPAVVAETLTIEAAGSPWAIVDEMIGDTRYRTHYLCRNCCADLTELRVHYVVCCPYCAAELPFLLDPQQQDQPHTQFDGWPYELLDQRFPGWCNWHGMWAGDEGERLPDGGWTRRMYSCRLAEHHAGEHDFGPGRVPFSRNPIREAAKR